MFFKPKANLHDSEKSRIEFHLQQIAECIGFDRFTLPVLSRKTLFGFYDTKGDPKKIIDSVGKHLAHDVGDVQFRVVPQMAQSTCGSGCGGGTCGGVGSLPGRYDAENRSITLDIEIESDSQMGIAMLIQGVVSDLLSRNGFTSTHLPELVDLAVVGTGLGMVRNHVSLVKKQVSSWDSTQWELLPRPFAGTQTLAYANAIAAWVRDEANPEWVGDLPSDLKRPMRSTLKYLFKTKDAFLQPKMEHSSLSQSQSEWWKLAASDSASTQVIAIRHLQFDPDQSDQQESLLLEKLRSANTAISLNTIAAIEKMKLEGQWMVSQSIAQELRLLTAHRADEVRAKAMCALAKLDALDDVAVETAAFMLEDDLKHVVFAGVFALSTLESVPDHVYPPFDQCFVSALRSCDYEFVDLMVAAYGRWLNDPQPHFERLLQDSPEHLSIAIETLQKVPDQLVQLRRGA
ncbi:MAG: hypothetical protein AAF664_06240 [Planctomycetota bacterium]